MKLVTLTGGLSSRLGIEKAVEMIARAGFDGFDYTISSKDQWEIVYSDAWKAHLKKIMQCAKGNGIPCLQAHSPFGCVPEWYPLEEYLRMQIRSIEVAAEMECPILVIHPCWGTPKENDEMFYGKLLPTAERLGVVIATENMFRWKDKTCVETVPATCGTVKDFADHIDYINHPNFTACLDIGHAQMVNCEGAVALIRGLGKKRIGALHVHDNDLFHDDHTFPFVGRSDWNEITSALADIGYEGDFTFEANAFMSRYPNELLPSCEKLLHDTGRYLIKQIQKKRKSDK